MKRFLILTITLALLLAVFCLSAFAAETVDVQVFGVASYSRAEKVFEELNSYRQSLGLSSLVLDEGLTAAAMQRAVETSVFFSHTRPDGSECSTIISQVYGSAGNWAENIAAGQSSAGEVMSDWKASDGHDKNMKNTKVTHVGIGCVYVDGIYYWVQLFSSKGADSTSDYSSQSSVRFLNSVTVVKSYLSASSTSQTVSLTVDPDNDTVSGNTFTIQYLCSATDLQGGSVKSYAKLIPINFQLTDGKLNTVPVTDSSGNTIATLSLNTDSGSSTITVTPMTDESATGTIQLPIYKGQTDPITLTVDIHVHSYNASVYEPTCSHHGWTYYQCPGCGKYYTERIEATGVHIYGEWTYHPEPTRTSGGWRYQACIYDGCNEKIWEEVPPLSNPFVDVDLNEYYGDPVLWAVFHEVTKGTDDTHFSPNADCTRAQIVTFLWRSLGEPEPESSVNPFKDVKPDDYFYTAVLWAVEEGITKGTSDTAFSPNESCTRGQCVTFLWRMMEEPEADDSFFWFVDVPQTQYYYEAVAWAVDERITNGTGTITFSPDATCTRGQIVTFLYRTLK